MPEDMKNDIKDTEVEEYKNNSTLIENISKLFFFTNTYHELTLFSVN